jgi:hypothetical protein
MHAMRMHALHGISGAWHARPAIDFSDPPGLCQRGKPGVRRTAVFWIDTKFSTTVLNFKFMLGSGTGGFRQSKGHLGSWIVIT